MSGLCFRRQAPQCLEKRVLQVCGRDASLQTAPSACSSQPGTGTWCLSWSFTWELSSSLSFQGWLEDERLIISSARSVVTVPGKRTPDLGCVFSQKKEQELPRLEAKWKTVLLQHSQAQTKPQRVVWSCTELRESTTLSMIQNNSLRIKWDLRLTYTHPMT